MVAAGRAIVDSEGIVALCGTTLAVHLQWEQYCPHRRGTIIAVTSSTVMGRHVSVREIYSLEKHGQYVSTGVVLPDWGNVCDMRM